MAKSKFRTEFKIKRASDKCINCQACVRMCSNDTHEYDAETETITSYDERCVGCHFCEDMCPTGALVIEKELLNPRFKKIIGAIRIDEIRHAKLCQEIIEFLKK